MLTALNQVKPKDWSLCAHLLFFSKCSMALNAWNNFSGKAVPGKLRARGCKWSLTHRTQHHSNIVKKKETTCKLFCVFCFSCCLRWSFWRSQQYQAKQLLGWYCCLKTLSINFSGKAVPGNPITDNADHGKPRTTNPFFSNILLEWKAASNWYLP